MLKGEKKILPEKPKQHPSVTVDKKREQALRCAINAINELKKTHEDRFRIFEAMENTDNVEELKMFAEQFDVLEFEQQRIWGFPQDRNFHRWFDVPSDTFLNTLDLQIFWKDVFFR